MKIIPSILVQSKEEFIHQITALDHAVDMIQIDIADGIFVSQKTWAEPQTVSQVVPKDIHIELHLMIADPFAELKRWQDVPQVSRVLIPVESVSDVSLITPLTQDTSWDVGIVLNPETKLTTITPYLDLISVVMFMGVHPGKQGQTLMPEVLKKIQEFSEKKTGKRISLDGGVNENTLPDVIKAGADTVCPGSAIFRNDRTPKENVERMYRLIDTLKTEEE